MKIKNIVLLGASTLTLIACAKNSQNGASLDGQMAVGIVNGTPIPNPATDPVASHVVGLVFLMKAQPGQPAGQQGVALCTGTLVTQDIVLTAAHCAEIDFDQAFVVFSANAFKPVAGQVRKVVAKTVNSAWQPSNLSAMDIGDTALIKFAGALPAGYSPAEILQDSSALSAGTPVLEIGYGKSAPAAADDGAGIIREATVAILDSTTARTEVVTDESHGVGVCEGDSGGPAFVKVGNKYLMWGVASRVAGNAPTAKKPPTGNGQDQPVLCNQMSVETNIVPYANWMRTEIAKLEGSNPATVMANLAQ